MDISNRPNERGGQPVAESASPAAPPVTPVPVAAPANGAASGAIAAFRPIAREAMQERRRQERETGVPFVLDHDGFEARVRLLNIYERTTLLGLPGEVRQTILESFNAKDILPEPGKRTEEDLFKVLSMEDDTANAVCIVGFVWPRLVATTAEADAANDPDVWWVEEIHISDRKKYLALVSGQDKEEIARIRRFLRGELAGPQGAGSDGAVPAGTAAV